jgi:hypothetical protein
MLLGHLWEDVFDIFVSGITAVVDSSLQDALAVIKRQGEETAQALAATAVCASKRKSASSLGENGEPEGSGVPTSLEESHMPRPSVCDGRSRDTKRRRLTGPTSEHRHAPEETDVNLTDTTPDSNLQGILRELMLKMESQSQTLATLTEENTQVCSTRNLLRYIVFFTPFSCLQLKSSLQSKSFISRSSFSSTASSQPETPVMSNDISIRSGSRSVDRPLSSSERSLLLKDRRTPTKPSWTNSHRRTASHRD